MGIKSPQAGHQQSVLTSLPGAPDGLSDLRTTAVGTSVVNSLTQEYTSAPASATTARASPLHLCCPDAAVVGARGGYLQETPAPTQADGRVLWGITPPEVTGDRATG